MKRLLSILLSIPQALAGGFVFSHMWNWFIVRKFPGTPILSTLDAIGVLMVAYFPLLGIHLNELRAEIKKSDGSYDDTDVGIIISLVMMLCVYPALMLSAWIWHLIIGS